MSMHTLWIEVRVSAEQKHHDCILVNGIFPFVTEVGKLGLVHRSYFIRDRQSRPACIRLRLEVDPWSVDQVQALLSQVLDQQDLGKVIAGIDYALDFPRLEIEDLLEGPAAQHLLDDFFCDTNPLVLKQLSEINGRNAVRMRIAFDLMVAHVYATARMPTDSLSCPKSRLVSKVFLKNATHGLQRL
jgi:hypothetical protein